MMPLSADFQMYKKKPAKNVTDITE